MKKLTIITLLGILLMPLTAQNRASWMKDAKWGVMLHYTPVALVSEEIPDPDVIDMGKWNELIDHFDCDQLAKQLSDVGAGYFIITVRHVPPFFMSPNATYDRYTGQEPSRCSNRDLILDLYHALNKYGIKLITYIAVHAPGQNEAELKGFALERSDYYKFGAFERNPEALLRWQDVIREYSMRWGDKVSGWWFDGCYRPNTNYRHPDIPNFESVAAAARAGNPNSIITFNPGRFPRIMSITPHEDYTAGEINHLDRIRWSYHYDGMIDGKQMHILSYLGRTWGLGDPRFTDEEIVKYSLEINEVGGAITWDVPPMVDGTIPADFMKQLVTIGKALGTIEE